jgi:hypothetical protein
MTTKESVADAVQSLAHWSENCEHPTPFALFLDLIGWSEETYGERLCSEQQPAIGYVEASKLAQALEAWSERPREVEAIVADIIEEA